MNPITMTDRTIAPASFTSIFQPIEEAICTDFNYRDLVQQMVDEHSMRAAFRPEFAQVPDLYEKIKEQIYCHFPNEKALLKKIREAVGDIMDLDDADYLLKHYPEQKHLRRIREADRLLAISYTFTTPEEAKDFFARKKNGCVQILELEYFMEKQQALRAKKGISVAELTDEESKMINDNFGVTIETLALCELAQFDKMPLIRHLNLIKNADKHPLLKAQVEASQKKIEEYSSDLCQVIEKANGKPMRPQFKEFLCGPKAMLLEYYGFRFDSSLGFRYGREFPFPFYNIASRTMSFRYSLENDTIADLEKEMRNDLISCGTEELPPPICTSETAIIPPQLSEHELSIQKHFNEKAEEWPAMSDLNKQYWIEAFLLYTKLEGLGIRTDQVNVTSFTKDNTMKGTLLISESEVPFTYDIKHVSFNLDFLPRDSAASLYETRRILESGKSYYENIKTRYQLKP